MSKAEAYSNISLNETVVKFELDYNYKGSSNGELIIIADLINPSHKYYHDDRIQIVKEIIAKLDFNFSNIHFIYNDENGEAKYYDGNISSISNLNIGEIAPLKDNFNKISQRLKNLLNGFNSNSYINMLTLVNYNDDAEEPYKGTDDSIFYEYKKKFKNIYSQILFLDCGINHNYISFTRFCKGFAKRFLYVIPVIVENIHNSEDDPLEPYEEAKHKMEGYISSYSPKAIQYIFEYLRENMDKAKAKKLENFQKKLKSFNSDDFRNDFRNKVDQKIDDILSNYGETDLKSEKEINWDFEKKKYLADWPLSWNSYVHRLMSNVDYQNLDKKHPIYQIPYPSFLKEDIIIFIQQNLVNKIKAKFKLSKSQIKKEKIIEMSNRIYDQIQAYSKELIETGNYRVCFMNHDFFSNHNFCTCFFSADIFYGHFPELVGKFTAKEASILGCYIGGYGGGGFGLSRNPKENKNEGKELKKIEDIVKNIIDKKKSNLKNDIKSDKSKEQLLAYLDEDGNSKILGKAFEKIGMKDLDKFFDKMEEDEESEESEKKIDYEEKEKSLQNKELDKKIKDKEEEESLLKEKNKILYGTKDANNLKKASDKTKENRIDNSDQKEVKKENPLPDEKSENEDIPKKEKEEKNSNETGKKITSDKRKDYYYFLDILPKAKLEYYYTVKRPYDRLNAFRKEIVDEAKKDELLQKMQKVIIKFRQKLKEGYDIYKKIINLDKNAINFLEQKMENFTENDLFLFQNFTPHHIVNTQSQHHEYSFRKCDHHYSWHSNDFLEYSVETSPSSLSAYDKFITYFYNEKVNNYFRHFVGSNIWDYSMYLKYQSISKKGHEILLKKIKYLFDGIKKNIPSGWKITSKNGYFRIEPQGEKMKEIELPIGKSTIFMEGIYQKINESLKLESKEGNLNIENKGKVTQDNLKEIYEDAFNMIMNKIVENKLYEKNKDTNSINQELINFVKKIENETEGFANIKSKKISSILSDLNNNQQINSAENSEISQILISNISKCQEEIMGLIKEEIKLGANKIKPQFILLLDVSEKMDDFIEEFVRKILYQVLLRLNFEESDKIQIYTFNSEDTSNTICSVKKLKKISFECEGDIIFAEAFKNSLTEMSKVNNSRYYLLTILSGNVKDRDEIRAIAFKSIGLSAKIAIKSRVVRFDLNNGSNDTDEITDGLLQQISSGDLKVYKPIEIGFNESDEEKIKKIANSFL